MQSGCCLLTTLSITSFPPFPHQLLPSRRWSYADSTGVCAVTKRPHYCHVLPTSPGLKRWHLFPSQLLQQFEKTSLKCIYIFTGLMTNPDAPFQRGLLDCIVGSHNWTTASLACWEPVVLSLLSLSGDLPLLSPAALSSTRMKPGWWGGAGEGGIVRVLGKLFNQGRARSTFLMLNL